MNGVELSRQVAANLHVQAVASGLDPWLPYDFAMAEAKRRDIDVEPAERGAAVLNNGRAAFLPEDRLILYENVGTPFEQAFLIAHEIGHAELGDDHGREPASEINPVRSAEPSPVGIDRIIDYDRKQRREIQMDLFAREFLLPRSFVRELHLEKCLTASAIAQRLGAPFDVVAQQLFDALLLPAITSEAGAERVEQSLNSLQEKAAKYRGGAYLLEAGPGTGKTQTLVARVDGLLADGIDPRRILLLTFSNKAAGEMTERIAQKHKGAAAMWIGTFHSFGLDLIRRFHLELGLSDDPRMMDRTEAVELLESEFPKLGLHHYRNLYDPVQIIADILSAISRAKDEVIDAKQYAVLADAMLRKAVTGEDRESAERALEVARVYEAYESLKRRALCVDFGDLVSMPVQLLEGDMKVRAHLQAQYDHVLVDEYQDVNRSSVRLLTMLRRNGENLWVVGDAKQSIYRFRGASSFNMARFGKEDFVGGTRSCLKRNYRSVGEIVDAFSGFGVGMANGGANSGLETDRGVGGYKPELRTVNQTDQQTVALAEAIEEMHRAGHRYRDQAVLCTGNEKLSLLGQDLERLGVPVLFLGSLFERSEVKDLFAFLTLLTDPRMMGLTRVACWPGFEMPLSEVSSVLNHLRCTAYAPGEWLRNLEATAGLSNQGRVAVTRLNAALNGFDQRSSPWSVLATLLLDRTRMAAEIAGSVNIAERARGIAIWQLMNFVRTQPSDRGLPIVRLLERVRRLIRLGDDRDLRRLPASAQGIDAVRLMTIHGAKGLEFPVVHIPGLTSDTMPRVPSAPPCQPPDGMVEGGRGSAQEVFRAGHAEEQECLFYVALSRARDRLVIYAPTQKSNKQRRSLSPFLARLGQGLTQRHVTPLRSLPPAPESLAIELAIDGALSFSAAQIALYESCPRRFFYTHILEIGGHRSTTAFMQMHEAVRTVTQTMLVNGAPITGDDELNRIISDAFRTHGLSEHGYVDDYTAFASSMIRYFVAVRHGHTPEAPNALRVTLGEEQIIVRPDDVLVRADGGRTFRRIRTGHYRSSESKDVGAAAFVLAATQAFPTAVVELVYLSDQSTRTLTLSAKELQNRQSKLIDFLREIRQGHFPAYRTERTCPRCPAFFVCGQTPAGTLQKKFA